MLIALSDVLFPIEVCEYDSEKYHNMVVEYLIATGRV